MATALAATCPHPSPPFCQSQFSPFAPFFPHLRLLEPGCQPVGCCATQLALPITEEPELSLRASAVPPTHPSWPGGGGDDVHGPGILHPAQLVAEPHRLQTQLLGEKRFSDTAGCSGTFCAALPSPRGRTGGARHCHGSPVRLLGAGSSPQAPGTGCSVSTCTLHRGRRSHRPSRCGRGLRLLCLQPGGSGSAWRGAPCGQEGLGGCSPLTGEHDGAGYAVPAPPCRTPPAPPSAPLPATPPAEQGWR